MSDPTSIHDDDADDLRDPVLQRALENAPDQAATPDWRLGESIRAMAHEAVAPSLPELPLQRTWWQRLLGIGAGGGVPWNAAFATVLVGVLVTLMWQREEVPGARPDGAQQQAAPAAAAPQAEVAQGAPAPAPAPAAPPAPEPAPPPSALDAQLAESRATNAAATRALDEDEARAKRDRQAETEAATARARALRKESARPPPPVPPAPPAAPATAEAPSGRAAPQAAITERRTFAAPQDAAPAAAPPRAAAVAPAPAAIEPAAAAAPPSFAALSQWTVLHITRPDGETRTLQRAEARELGALIGSAALAGVGARPLRAKVDWRLTLDRNGEALAVLELAGGQVRWREEGVAPGVGSPGAGAMKGLRAALEEASAPAQQPSPPR
ncbi:MULTISPECIES: hypothetical protein [unclassified Variovorax]|uniref:hypothetical protein n=1 Tax=unclassified Variovorax TaxID=663243 RepID=UPI0025783C98|nr:MULTISPECIES: hypothetical protein [unclassified Variovorax]MDM0089519.1 hypothetical protein [Variovorax sp. J22G40]MDM0147591.1 hypothetical protein [Variovorax sp. J2P1-31]